jgi:ankyrin repeat protein
MKVCNLYNLCNDKKWSEGRKYLSSDAAEEEKKSNIMYLNDDGWTCLLLAFRDKAPDDIIKAMLDIGGKELVMMIDNEDWTVLHDACLNCASYNILKMLIEVVGKDIIMAKNSTGDTALHFLCSSIEEHTRPAKKIKLILQVGDANLLLSSKNHAGQTPLEIADDMDASSEIKKLLLSTTLIKNE